MKQLLTELCALDGISGYEENVRDYILQKLKASNAPMEVKTDALGNILVHLIGKQPAGKKILFDAHMDEVGFLVTHINDDGSLCFDTVGGIDSQVLFGHRIRIGSYIGVVGGKSTHHCSADEKNVIPSTLTIDIGASSRAQAEKWVSVGQWGTFYAPLQEMGDEFICTKAIDDRVGCALLLSLAKTQPLYDIWLSFSVQEEIGLRGAKVIGEQIQPDIAIIIDATTAADTVGSNDATCVCKVGQGAVVSFADRATIYETELYTAIRAIATQYNLATQTKNKISGGNNAGGYQRSYTGVRVAAVSLPCRYIHSPACTAHMSDVYTMDTLLHKLAERLPL